MKRLLFLLIVPLCGCTSFPKVVRELAKDTNSCTLTIHSPVYGWLQYTRNGGTINSSPTVAAPITILPGSKLQVTP